MSNNNKSPKIHESNSKNEANKDTKKFNFKAFECINYSKFDEMRRQLDNFYIELTNSIKEGNTKIENENVKKGFFNSLESLLIEISQIKDEKLRITKIDDVFKWFKRKVSSFQNIKIDFKTSKSKFQKYPVSESYKKSDNHEAINIQNAFEKENKSPIEENDPVKERLKRNKNKKIFPLKIKIIDEHLAKAKNHFKTNEISFQINVSSLNTLTKKESIITFNKNPNQINFPLKIKVETRLSSAAISNNLKNPNSSNQNFNFPYFSSSSNNLKISIDALDKNASLIDTKKYETDSQLNNLFSERDANIDLKFTGSPNRPKNEYASLGVDKQILIHKLNEISEKRNYEEMKEYLNDLAVNKASFKEEMEKKYELKKLINFYEKSFQEKLEETKSVCINLKNLNLKKTNSPGPIKIRRDKTFSENLFNKKACFEINSTDNFSIISNEKVSIVNKEHEQIKEDPNLTLKNQIRNANRIFYNYNRLNFNKVKNYQNKEFSDRKANDKSLTSNFKTENFSYHTQLKQNLIKININFNEFDMAKKHSNIIPQIKKSLDKIPTNPSLLLKTHDRIFESKQNFSKLLQVNELENENLDSLYKFHINPLALNDFVNINATSVSPNCALNTNGYATGFDFTYKNSDNCENENFNFNSFASSKNNALLQRRTVSFNNKGFMNNNNHLLTQKQKLRKSNFNFTHDAIKKAFLPPADDKKYPKYFLPQPGFGLLTRTNIKIEKKV